MIYPPQNPLFARDISRNAQVRMLTLDPREKALPMREGFLRERAVGGSGAVLRLAAALVGLVVLAVLLHLLGDALGAARDLRIGILGVAIQ